MLTPLFRSDAIDAICRQPLCFAYDKSAMRLAALADAAAEAAFRYAGDAARCLLPMLLRYAPYAARCDMPPYVTPSPPRYAPFDADYFRR